MGHTDILIEKRAARHIQESSLDKVYSFKSACNIINETHYYHTLLRDLRIEIAVWLADEVEGSPYSDYQTKYV